MPRKITAFSCQYKCGHFFKINKTRIEKRIAKHEEGCFSNPSRRACKTCLQFDIDEDGYYCNKDHLKENQYATKECKYWELKEE